MKSCIGPIVKQIWICDEVSLLFSNFIRTTAYRLGQYLWCLHLLLKKSSMLAWTLNLLHNKCVSIFLQFFNIIIILLIWNVFSGSKKSKFRRMEKVIFSVLEIYFKCRGLLLRKITFQTIFYSTFYHFDTFTYKQMVCNILM